MVWKQNKETAIQTASWSFARQSVHTLGANVHTTLPPGHVFFAVINGIDQFFRDNIRRDGVNGINITAASSTVGHKNE